MLKYALVENEMVTEPCSCVAVVSSPDVKNLNDLIDFMIAEGTGLTRPQALAYFEKLTHTIEYFVGQGYRVVTPLFRIQPSITGIFNDKKDTFDANRHKISIRTSSGLRLKELPSKIKLEKVDIPQYNPVPQIFINASNSEINSSATSGGIAVLKGDRMKFDSSDSALGIFFAPVKNPANEIRVNLYSGIKPSEIHFLIPELPSGDYIIVVKTLSRNGKYTQEGSLKQVIKV